MNAQIERRRNPVAIEDEALSPELVALLVMCGADVRAADRDLVELANQSDTLERRGFERRRLEAD